MFGISNNLLLENEDEESSPNRPLASEAASAPMAAPMAAPMVAPMAAPVVAPVAAPIEAENEPAPENEEASGNEVAEARAELMKFNKETRLKFWKAMQQQNEQNDPVLYDLLKEEFGDLEESPASAPEAVSNEEEFELNNLNEEENEEEDADEEEVEEDADEDAVEEVADVEANADEEEEEAYPDAIIEEDEKEADEDELLDNDEFVLNDADEEPAVEQVPVEPVMEQPAENNQGLKSFLAGKSPEQLEMMWRMNLDEADRALVQAELEKRGLPLPAINNNNLSLIHI